MPKKWLPGHNPLRPFQLQFIRRLERGDATAEQVLAELKITGTVFGQWLQKPVFARRYRLALQQVQARAVSLEAIAQLNSAKQKLIANQSPAEKSSEQPTLDLQSPLAQHLLDLHSAATIQKIKDADQSERQK